MSPGIIRLLRNMNILGEGIVLQTIVILHILMFKFRLMYKVQTDMTS